MRKVGGRAGTLVAANVTDPIRIAQGVRRTVGKGGNPRRQPMIVDHVSKTRLTLLGVGRSSLDLHLRLRPVGLDVALTSSSGLACSVSRQP